MTAPYEALGSVEVGDIDGVIGGVTGVEVDNSKTHPEADDGPVRSIRVSGSR